MVAGKGNWSPMLAGEAVLGNVRYGVDGLLPTQGTGSPIPSLKAAIHER